MPKENDLIIKGLGEALGKTSEALKYFYKRILSSHAIKSQM